MALSFWQNLRSILIEDDGSHTTNEQQESHTLRTPGELGGGLTTIATASMSADRVRSLSGLSRCQLASPTNPYHLS